MTTTEFKQRHKNYKKSFRDARYENDTGLSKLIWSLQKNDLMILMKLSQKK